MESVMKRASRRLGGIALLLVSGSVATLWWQQTSVPPADEATGLVVVHGPQARPSAKSAKSAIVTRATVPDIPPAAAVADPVVAERRDTKILQAVAANISPDGAVLDGAMMRQDRNAATANPIEAAMRSALLRIPALANGADPPRVLCVRTTCEATGRAARGRSAAEIEQALRDPAMLHAMVARGYTPGPATVAAAASGAVDYVLYLNNKM
jgi:hypothetical protein